ncbi:MAG: hypothetical protein ACI814_000371 [Mariniblastus sp.]|jgi:hypothetical protein
MCAPAFRQARVSGFDGKLGHCHLRLPLAIVGALGVENEKKECH